MNAAGAAPLPASATAFRLRWIAVAVFSFSSVLNYLDRQVLATMVDIWRTRPEFAFNYADYGLLLSVFSLCYAIAAPFMGWFLDRVGLNRGIACAVLLWAVASAGTGFAHSVNHLLWWRALLGVAEAAGISAAGKMTGLYLPAPERAVGAATAQLGLSIGAGVAPRVAVFFAYQYSWPWAFYSVALLSMVWIPVWLATARAVPPAAAEARAAAESGVNSFELVRDPRLWALVAANMIGMTLYSLWTNWSPSYLVRVCHLTPAAASGYSWIVPLAGYAGAFAGGSLSWRFIKRGAEAADARIRVCMWAGVLALATALLPLLASPALATAGMSLSFFAIAAWSTNLYTIPVDIFGAGRAAFGVSALVFAYGAMQAIVSKPLGGFIEQHGFAAVCLAFAALPVMGAVLVRMVVGREHRRTTARIFPSSG